MEVLLVVLAVLLVGGATVAFVARSRERGAGGTVELEPPAAPTVAPTIAPAPTVEPEVEPDVAVVDEDTVAEIPDVGITDALAPAPEVLERPRFRDRLAKARTAFAGYLGRSTIDQDTWDELEDALILADVGVGLAGELLESLRATVKERNLTTPEELTQALKDELKARLAADRSLRFEGGGRPDVWLFVGVNGVGKTTTIGKVGARERADGRTVVMAAGDTFRAAAAEQLGTWAERAGAHLVRGAEGADPSSVVFDAIESAASRGADLVLADTAGRLHTKSNLMEELRKVRRVADKADGNVTEVLLVLDATTGQNGLVQAREFTGAVDVTGVVLTKLDGSAKGGIVLAIQHELGIPVKLVGLGESAGDLVEFDPDEFVEALLS